MRNELQRHKRSDKVKWTLTAIMFVLIAIMLAGICLQVFGRGMVQPSEWFKKADKQTEQDENTALEIVTASPLYAASNDISAQTDSPQVGDIVETIGLLRFKCEATGLDIYREFDCTIEYVAMGANLTQWWTATADLSDILSYYSIGSCSDDNYASASIGKTGIVTVKNEYQVQFWEQRDRYYFNLKVKSELFPSESTAEIAYGEWSTPPTIYEINAFIKLADGTKICEVPATLSEVYRSVTVDPSLSAVFGYDRTEYKCVFTVDVSALKQMGYTNFRPFINGAFYGWDKSGNIFTRYSSARNNSFASEFTYSPFKDGLGLYCDMDFEIVEVALLQAPERDGYDFLYWCTDEALQNRVTETYVRADITLYPKYEIKTYVITFVTRLGNSIEPIQAEHFSVPALPDLEYPGYNFKGWTTEDGEYYDNTAQITGPLTLVAQWEIKTFKIIFMYHDGEVYREITVNYGTKLLDVIAEANADNLQVTAIRTSSGHPVSDISQTEVSEDYEMQVEEMTGVDKVKNTFKNHWLTIVLSIVLLIVIICLVCSLCGRKKSYRRR